VKISFQMRTYG